MIEPLIIIVAVIVTASALIVGWALGQGLCRREVRRHLWALFYALDPEGPASHAKYSILELIKKLEV